MPEDKKGQQVAEWGVNAGWSGRGNLTTLLAELERQKESKIDFVADTRHLQVLDHDDRSEKPKKDIRLVPVSDKMGEWMPRAGMPFTRNALGNLGAKLTPTVPSRFLYELADHDKTITARLLNDLMVKTPETRLIRCLDGNVRAILSDRYRILDNYDIAFTALDVVREAGGEVIEASLSDTHMRMKFTSLSIFDAIKSEREQPNWRYGGGLGNQQYLSKVAARTGGELPGGPGTVHPLVTISNSETGDGGFNVRLGLLKGICFNLATIEDLIAKVHLGGKLEQGLFTQETIAADNKAIFLKVRDMIKAAFESDHFKRLVAMAQNAQDDVIANPTTALNNLAKDVGLSDDGRDRILEYFLRDYSQTRWGLAQAIARVAQDIDAPESATMMEDLAGRLIKDEKLVEV